MKLFFFIVLLILSIMVICYNIYNNIYTWFNHYGWEENSTPDKNAKIQNINSEKVQYSRNGAKLKTKISFSDGFYFITYKTDRDNGFLTYKIYLSNELREKIINMAIKQHNLSVDVFLKDKLSTTHNTCHVNIKTRKDIDKIKIQIINNGSYLNLESSDRIEYLDAQKAQIVLKLEALNEALKIESEKIRNLPADIAKYINSNDIHSLKNDILKLENKKLALEELIASEINDVYNKKKYKMLANIELSKKIPD